MISGVKWSPKWGNHFSYDSPRAAACVRGVDDFDLDVSLSCREFYALHDRLKLILRTTTYDDEISDLFSFFEFSGENSSFRSRDDGGGHRSDHRHVSLIPSCSSRRALQDGTNFGAFWTKSNEDIRKTSGEILYFHFSEKNENSAHRKSFFPPNITFGEEGRIAPFIELPRYVFWGILKGNFSSFWRIPLGMWENVCPMWNGDRMSWYITYFFILLLVFELVGLWLCFMIVAGRYGLQSSHCCEEATSPIQGKLGSSNACSNIFTFMNYLYMYMGLLGEKLFYFGKKSRVKTYSCFLIYMGLLCVIVGFLSVGDTWTLGQEPCPAGIEGFLHSPWRGDYKCWYAQGSTLASEGLVNSVTHSPKHTLYNVGSVVYVTQLYDVHNHVV